MRRTWGSLLALIAAPVAAAQTNDGRVAQVSGLNAAQLFAAADRLLGEDRAADAAKLLKALAGDADLQVRNEARFRLARLREKEGRRADAAVLLRRILDEEPGAARVRLELARILVLAGDEQGARQQLRQAQSAGLPADLSRVVDQFRTALRSRAPYGATVEIAIAPDSNVNRATARQTLDAGLFPIELSDDARERSGIGVAMNGQAFARVPIASNLQVLPRLGGTARLYRDGRFDDVGIDARVGIERTDKTLGRLTLSGGHERRRFGGRPLSRSLVAALDWLRPVSRTAQVTIGASAARQRYQTSRAQDGGLYQFSAGYERALTRRAGISLSVSGARQDAVDRGYANWSGGLTALGYVEAGRATVFATTTVRRLEADEPFFLFAVPRREWLARSVVGATLRQATVAGFAPVLRVVIERNRSTVGLFDYRRIAAEIGVVRAF